MRPGAITKSDSIPLKYYMFKRLKSKLLMSPQRSITGLFSSVELHNIFQLIVLV